MQLSKSEADHYRDIANNCAQEGDEEKPDARKMVLWAMSHNHLQNSVEDWVGYHTARMSEALRTDTTRDDQGRKVRRWHSLAVKETDPETGKVVQRTLWGRVDKSSERFLLGSIRQKLQGIRADFRAIEADVDFIAEHHPRLKKKFTQLLISFNPRTEETV